MTQMSWLGRKTSTQLIKCYLKKYRINTKYLDILIFTTLWSNLADDNDKSSMVFLFSPENRIWHFMQIVS